MRPRKTIGVLGGKGPEATEQLFRLIIQHTSVTREEDHLRVIIDNNPQIPKPALGITGEGENPIPSLVATARNLENARADFIVIPCNSAHYYVDDVRKAVSIPVLSIITETIAAARKAGCAHVGLLASTGLVSTGLYQAGLEREKIAALVPNEADQAAMMQGILHFKDTGKEGPLSAALSGICGRLIDQGADGLILGCTELPVVLSSSSFTIPCFDTIEILALAAIREATRS